VIASQELIVGPADSNVRRRCLALVGPEEIRPLRFGPDESDFAVSEVWAMTSDSPGYGITPTDRARQFCAAMNAWGWYPQA
jgi:hypothetical protein